MERIEEWGNEKRNKIEKKRMERNGDEEREEKGMGYIEILKRRIDLSDMEEDMWDDIERIIWSVGLK